MRDHCLGPGAHPIAQYSWSSLRAANGRDVSIAQTTGIRLGRQHNTPGHLRCFAREFRCSLFDRCTLHFNPRNLVFICVDSNLSGGFASSAVHARWSAVSSRQPGYCTSPSCLRHASCPPSMLCSTARRACHFRLHGPHETTNRARTYARAHSMHLSQLMLLASPPTRCSTFASAQASVLRHSRAHRPHRPAQAAWDPTRPTGAAADSNSC